MLMKYKVVLAAFFVLLVCCLAYSANYYAGKYRLAQYELDKASAAITTMQSQQKTASELDAKYTKDLADAQNTIDSLRDDVATGTKWLSVKAKCVPNTTTGGSVGDAGAAELDESARQDYYRLREMMNQQGKQIRYLQDYIRSVVNGEKAKVE